MATDGLRQLGRRAQPTRHEKHRVAGSGGAAAPRAASAGHPHRRSHRSAMASPPPRSARTQGGWSPCNGMTEHVAHDLAAPGEATGTAGDPQRPDLAQPQTGDHTIRVIARQRARRRRRRHDDHRRRTRTDPCSTPPHDLQQEQQTWPPAYLVASGSPRSSVSCPSDVTRQRTPAASRKVIQICRRPSAKSVPRPTNS
jgi:hypothetical protein